MLDREEGEEKGNESERGQEGEREGVGEQRKRDMSRNREAGRQNGTLILLDTDHVRASGKLPFQKTHSTFLCHPDSWQIFPGAYL